MVPGPPTQHRLCKLRDFTLVLVVSISLVYPGVVFVFMDRFCVSFSCDPWYDEDQHLMYCWIFQLTLIYVTATEGRQTIAAGASGTEAGTFWKNLVDTKAVLVHQIARSSEDPCLPSGMIFVTCSTFRCCCVVCLNESYYI